MATGKILNNGVITDINRVAPSVEQQNIIDKADRLRAINAEISILDNKLPKSEYIMIKAGQISNLTPHQIEFVAKKDALFAEQLTLETELGI